MANPHTDPVAAAHFNASARRLWVPVAEIERAVDTLRRHEHGGRPRERDHALAQRDVRLRASPPLVTRPVPQDRRDRSGWTRASPMDAVDATFVAIVQANPHLRPRVGNPDEMRSNRLGRTLEALRFRVTDPEPGLPEDVQGAVVTALNEEAVAGAALANKGGINLVHTYEAFGTKMLGLLRQEIIFAEHSRDAGRRQGWLSVPLVLTSHTWENAKNELSHQDPSLAEALLGEHSDVSRVIFVPDFNTAAVTMQRLYQTHGQFWALVVPKSAVVPDLFTLEEGSRLLEQGALRLDWAGHDVDRQRLVLTAVGAYQLEEVLKASARLRERDVPHSVIALLEPGRFRVPRTEGEEAHAAPVALRDELYPDRVPLRLFVTHTRPEPLLGILEPLHTGAGRTAALGFLGQGGTLTIAGMLFVNRCTWAHALARAARLLGLAREDLLTAAERDVLDGRAAPEGVIF
jgi:phosphoketolase